MQTIKPNITSPSTEEYAPFYSDYIQRATARGDVIAAFPLQIEELNSALGKLTDEQARFRNGPAEWSIKEIVSHLIDVERIFSYRLLCVSRNDSTPLPGFEQNDYVRESGADELPLAELLNEFEFLRCANMLAVNHISADALLRIGTASRNPISARALVYILVGHVDHHMASMQEKYLPFIR